MDPLVTVSANASGGVTGKMISPQSIAIGSAAVGLVGQEANLFRFTVKHSFIMLTVICIVTMLQAYVITWIVPKYKTLEAAIKTEGENLSKGFFYLLLLAIVLAFIGGIVFLLNRKKKALLEPSFRKGQPAPSFSSQTQD